MMDVIRGVDLQSQSMDGPIVLVLMSCDGERSESLEGRQQSLYRGLSQGYLDSIALSEPGVAQHDR